MTKITLLRLAQGLLTLSLFGCAQTQVLMPALPLRSIDESQKVCPHAKYPRAAFQSHTTGTTKLSFLVDASGKVSEARVIQKSGNTAEHALLDEEALKIINACRFPEAKGYAPVRAIQAFKWELAD